MAVNLLKTARKLISALNTHGYNLVYGSRQFLGREGKTHTYYSVYQAVWDEDKEKYINQELYSTTGMVRLTLFLRDMWFAENGWDLPMDNEMWNELRIQIKEDIENGKYGTRNV